MDILVGFSGFVGSNIAASHTFDGLFNSKNIEQAFGQKPDLCIYSGVRAEKYIAAQDPEKDKTTIYNAIENIKKINPTRLVLISTIDVYPTPYNVNESYAIDTHNAHPYGANRYLLEQWVSENMENSLIVRLPALYGKNIKKNFIYDLIHIVPSLLRENKYMELSVMEPLIAESYINQGNGFYKYAANGHNRAKLIEAFERVNFSALNFTDSRAKFQFYNLAYLWRHITLALENGLSLLNLAVEPLSVSKIYKAVKSNTFVNEIACDVPHYDFKTIHAQLFGGDNGYIFTNKQVLEEICDFIKNEKVGLL